MQSTFAWLDYSAAERERTQRVLAMFDERETRDELGIGAIRDSFADHFFPGTSTIQTRLRYMFFVPWIYLELERQRVPSREIGKRARKIELELATRLLGAGETEGVFGAVAKGELKRLPSSVYWAGLRYYGICSYPGSRDDYHRDLDSIYLRRQRSRREAEERRELYQSTWHPKLPTAPSDLMERPSFRLTTEEAEFFRERLRAECSGSLLEFLAWNSKPPDVDFPWLHPSLASFSAQHREMLEHARLFSLVMYGSSILYNLMLAEIAVRDDWQADLRKLREQWLEDVRADGGTFDQWKLHRFWELVGHPNHTITSSTRDFVETWVRLVLSKDDLAGEQPARQLIKQREMRLKGARSRFLSRRTLEKWGGEAGLYRLTFRWRNASRFLKDLAGV